MNLSARTSNRLMLLITLVALFIGLYNLGDRRIGSDELKTLGFIKDHAPLEALTVYYSSNHIPYVFLLTTLYQWTDKLYILRLVSVICGVLAVAMTYRLGKSLTVTYPDVWPFRAGAEVRGRVLALSASFFLIIAPFFVRYFREMRGYAMTLFLGLVAFFCLWQVLVANRPADQAGRPEHKWYWIGFALAAALSAYTHFYTVFMIATAGLLVVGEWLLARKPARQTLRPFCFSLLALGLLLALVLAPVAQQILAVPSTEELSPPEFGPFALSGYFARQLSDVLRMLSPLGDGRQPAYTFLIFVLLGSWVGLRHRWQRRSTTWLLLWWLAPFLTNLITLNFVPAAQIRYHLFTLPAYLLLGLRGMLALAEGVVILSHRFAPHRLLSRPGGLYLGITILILATSLPRTGQLLRELHHLAAGDQAWTAVAAYLRTEARPEDMILCEVFELPGGDEGKCSWQLHDLGRLTRTGVSIPYFNQVANFRGAEQRREMLQSQGRVWFVLYFRQPSPPQMTEFQAGPGLTVRRFGRTWVIGVEAGQSLLENLIACGQVLLKHLPDEDHQFRYHLDLAQLYALAGDQATANSHLEQAIQLQQQSTDSKRIPELRTVAALVRFYAPADPVPQHRLAVNFDNRLKLSGYSLQPDALAPARSDPAQPVSVKFSLYWQVLAPLEKDYAVFVHLADSSGNIISHLDFQPFDTIYPTSHWPAGAELREARQFLIPGELPPGQYTFVIGLYLPDDLSRLRIVDDPSGENAVRLGQLRVEGRGF